MITLNKPQYLTYNHTQLFDRRIIETLVDENFANRSDGFLAHIKGLIHSFFDRLEAFEIRRKSEVFNEVEAAVFLRLPDPSTAGRKSIRYYALDMKTLPYIKIGRDGLYFTKPDIENFLKNQKVTSHREL